jgi:hypothetical protein
MSRRFSLAASVHIAIGLLGCGPTPAVTKAPSAALAAEVVGTPASAAPAETESSVPPAEAPAEIVEPAPPPPEPRPLQPTSSAVPAKGEVLLYDPSAGRGCCKPKPAEEARTIDALFPKRVATWKECPQDPPTSDEQAIAEGTLSPDLTGLVRGAFSSPGADESVALVTLWMCGSVHAEFGRAQLVLFQGAAVALRAPVEANAIARTFDVDGDGRLELVLTYGYTGAGGGGEAANVVSLADGRFRVVAELGETSSYGCDFFPDGDEQVTPTWVVVGSPPTFRQMARRTPC